MTIILHWWMGPLLLFLLPFVVFHFRKTPPRSGDYSFDIGGMFLAVGLYGVCWSAAITWLVVKWVTP